MEGDAVHKLAGTNISNFNPLPPCGERQRLCLIRDTAPKISIHSLRVEGDAINPITAGAAIDFNPLPPCGGRPTERPSSSVSVIPFQSTPSVWRETTVTSQLTVSASNFNPLPPCGGRLPCSHGRFSEISRFQSTPSVWRETISFICYSPYSNHFNPLPPCGGRQILTIYRQLNTLFQSTPSVWRETFFYFFLNRHREISIHSLRVEGDNVDESGQIIEKAISIHSLRVEGDIKQRSVLITTSLFQSTPSVWRETYDYVSKVTHGR